MPKPIISVLLPTRGRKKMAERFLTTASKLAAYPEYLEFVLYIDADDVESRLIAVKNVNYRAIIEPRLTMGICNTRCFQESIGDIIVLGNDDVVIRTEGWDEIIREVHKSTPDQIYLAYPNDLNKGESLAAFPIMSRKTCELLIEPFPKVFKGSFIDSHLMEIFFILTQLGLPRIHYMDSLIFEHLHYRIGKSAFDATYKERSRFSDDEIFLGLSEYRVNCARSLAGYILDNQIVPASSAKLPPRNTRSSGFFYYVDLVSSAYLFNGVLPLWFRLKKTFYFLARGLASRVGLFN